ncbi:hypothetical protein Ciccas_001242 [Cichlidogyrus casuarinus]|uniref:Neurotransmitter-gated ion-channel transmembrane domain-containing protein n=1 Tax=Cichlidogyrus casuarinus TaxID=1844966 RepID=A0ABD2QKW1_9PLAT
MDHSKRDGSNLFKQHYRLKRNSTFSMCILILPCVLLSSLTLVIFLLPPESAAKMVLGMNIFVAFFLLLLLLKDSTPQATLKVPYIGIYYCFNMIMITLSSFFGVGVVNCYFRGDKSNRLPSFLLAIMVAIGIIEPPTASQLPPPMGRLGSLLARFCGIAPLNLPETPIKDVKNNFPNSCLKKDSSSANLENKQVMIVSGREEQIIRNRKKTKNLQQPQQFRQPNGVLPQAQNRELQSLLTKSPRLVHLILY